MQRHSKRDWDDELAESDQNQQVNHRPVQRQVANQPVNHSTNDAPELPNTEEARADLKSHGNYDSPADRSQSANGDGLDALKQHYQKQAAQRDPLSDRSPQTSHAQDHNQKHGKTPQKNDDDQRNKQNEKEAFGPGNTDNDPEKQKKDKDAKKHKKDQDSFNPLDMARNQLSEDDPDKKDADKEQEKEDRKKRHQRERQVAHALTSKPARTVIGAWLAKDAADSAAYTVKHVVGSWWNNYGPGLWLHKAGHALHGLWNATKHGCAWIGNHVSHFFHWAGAHLSHLSAHLGALLHHIGAIMASNSIVTGGITTVMASTVLAGAGYGVYSLTQPTKFAEVEECSTQSPSAADQNAMAGQGGNVNVQAGGQFMDNIKKTWDFLVQKEGFSGAAAAGACGNEMQESGGNPKVKNPRSPVVGIFQWGNGGRNSDRLHTAGIIKSADDETLANELKLTDYELHHEFASWTPKYLKLTDPTEAATRWCEDYEQCGQQGLANRIAFAKQFYKEWNGSSVNANPSAFGAAAAADGVAGANDATAQALAAQNCGNGNGSATTQADGTGAIKESAPSGVGSWSFDNIPADMKQYIPDPKKVGMAWGNPSGWTQEGGGGGQCVDFSVSYFHHIWKGAPATCMGNGKDIAANEAKMMGGQVSNTPHAGAIASAPAYCDPHVVGSGANGQYGHTFVVVHVLANGDILVLQQNFVYSGDNVGKKNTWEVGLYTKQEYQRCKFQFFTPKGTPNWG